MTYINCEKYSNEILDEVKKEMETISTLNMFAIVSVGDNPASNSYIRGKIKDCEYCDIPYFHVNIDPLLEDSQTRLRETLCTLASNERVSSIILQLPLPAGWDEEEFLPLIPPGKDVDGLNRNSPFKPCTPEGIVYLLKKELGNLEGKNALIIGRGKLVGRPLVDLLLEENCTITIAHSKTKYVVDLIKEDFDFIISATGQPKLVDLMDCDCEMVIDAGINRIDGKLCGDCYNFDEDEEGYFYNLKVTPVPRGVGLMTRAILIKHILEATKNQIEGENKNG